MRMLRLIPKGTTRYEEESSMDLKEVLNNLGILAKGSKLTLDEHAYLQQGLKEISDKLEELQKLKEAEKKDKE